MALQVARNGVHVPSDEETAALRREFDARHCIRVMGFLAPDLLHWARNRLQTAPFVWQVHEGTDPPARNLQLADATLHGSLRALLNDTRLFMAVERLTGCASIGCCWPHVYSLDATPGSYDAWHDDVDGNRLVAVSINVGGAYVGGTLRIREKHSRHIVSEVNNTGDGSAVLFRIADGFEHFVSPVTAGVRLAIAGWFQREPAARDLLRL